MPESITLTVNGVPITVQAGTVVAVAVIRAGQTTFRKSATGQARGPLCGMGICFECRVTVDGQPHVRSCQVVCRNGMDVHTDE